jgi:restriction system protein
LYLARTDRACDRLYKRWTAERQWQHVLIFGDKVAQQFARYINPVLSAIKTLGGSARPAEVRAKVVQDLGLENSPLLQATLKSGVSRFDNQIAWVRMYLGAAGYIDGSRHGVWALTEKGRSSPPLSDEDIRQLLIYVPKLSKKTGEKVDAIADEKQPTQDEDEAPDGAAHRSQLLEILRGLPPSGFERLCQRLLRESGFQQVEVTGRSGDGGIDGIGVLKMNHFVAFKVLFQCKRYSKTVSASQVRDFRGAMQGRADKGIILTTGSFTGEAQKEAVREGVPPIELVDSESLVELFEKLELGLTPRITYDVDLKFFAEFDDGGAHAPNDVSD